MHSLAQAALTTWISFIQVHSVNNAYKYSLLWLPWIFANAIAVLSNVVLHHHYKCQQSKMETNIFPFLYWIKVIFIFRVPWESRTLRVSEPSWKTAALRNEEIILFSNENFCSLISVKKTVCCSLLTETEIKALAKTIAAKCWLGPISENHLLYVTTTVILWISSNFYLDQTT